MLSNKQIFSNTVFPKETSTDVPWTGHDITKIQIDHAFPVLVLMIILSIVLIFILIIYIRDNYIFKTSQEEELLGIENLLNFYHSLYKSDLEYWIGEEMQMR